MHSSYALLNCEIAGVDLIAPSRCADFTLFNASDTLAHYIIYIICVLYMRRQFAAAQIYYMQNF